MSSDTINHLVNFNLMNLHKKVYIFFLCFVFGISQVYGYLNINNIKYDDQIFYKGQFYEDKSLKLNIDLILNTQAGILFKEVAKRNNNFGYSSSAFWYKLPIFSDSAKTNLVLACQNTTINYLDFYLVNDKGKVVKHSATGNALPFSTREFNNRFFIFGLNLEKHQNYTIYLKLKSEDSIDFSLVLADVNQYLDKQYLVQMIEGVFFGAIGIMGFYNLFLFFIILDSSYLYYVLYIFSALLFQFELGGWFNQFFMNNLPTISNKMGCVFLSFEILFIMLFLEKFTSKGFRNKVMKNLFYLIKVIAFAEIIFAIFIPLKYNLPFFVVLTMFGVIPCILFTIFDAIGKGVSSTKFMIIGWSAISFGGAMYALASVGVIPFNFISTYSMQIGTIIEMLFLSFALADRINILRFEKQEAQRETISQLEENAALLQKLNEEQKKAFGAVIQGEENERKRLAFELHDGIGQLLSVVKLNLSSLQQWVDKRNKKTAEVIDGIVLLVDDSCKEIRNISHNLMPDTVVQFGLMAALNDFCRKINVAGKIKVHFQDSDFEPDLIPQAQTTIYRIIQEILHNAIRHSFATDVYIQLFKEDENLVLLIEDNGIGFDVSATMKSDNGMGIRNIISRIEYLKGEVHIESSKGKGTMYNIHLNLQLNHLVN